MIKKNTVQEMVLYYTPEKSEKVIKLKGVLVRMGIRIKNIGQDQIMEQVGCLAGIKGFEKQGNPARSLPVIPEEVLIMHNFSSGRIDELLSCLRKAGVEKINLKAVVTESNSQWTFYHLYEELKEEHEKMKETNQ